MPDFEVFESQDPTGGFSVGRSEAFASQTGGGEDNPSPAPVYSDSTSSADLFLAALKNGYAVWL